MLISEYNHTVDAKGRLFIPSKWREDLGSTFVITRGQKGCLFGMSLTEWEKLAAKLALLPLTDEKAQRLHRMLSRWATDCEVDKQGRILVSQKLREFASITSEATLVGMTNHIEIWSSEVIAHMDELENEDYDDVFAQAAQYGI